VDGEIVVAVDDRLDFDALGQRIHPADSRVALLADQTPAAFVAFDIVAVGDRSLLDEPFRVRRALLDEAVTPGPQVHVTPMTADRDVAAEWFRRVEGAGLDGLIAKDPEGRYEPDKRVLRKVKHQRTADCVAAGFRWHKDGKGVGSILLGIHAGTPEDPGDLRHVGVAASFTAKRRAELVDELAPLVLAPAGPEFADHPWSRWYDADAHETGQLPGAPNRWNSQRDQSWIPLRIERVAEVGYTFMTAGRFRGTTRLVRWRPDKLPSECTFDQLEVVAPMGFSDVLTPPAG
jgi:ATP-dependent DNA ligase